MGGEISHQVTKSPGPQTRKSPVARKKLLETGDWKLEICFLGLGSNLGKREKNIELALQYLGENKQIKLEKISSIIETAPILPQGAKPQRKFLNAVVKIKTSLSAQDLLATLKQIERRVGRRPAPRFSPRVIDLDILLYGNEKIDEENLKIPHPQIQERKFVKKLLREILNIHNIKN